MLTVEEIVQRIQANYSPAVKSLPLDLQEEFSARVLPSRDSEDLAPYIRHHRV
jgi:hypothetical protein